jgi:ribosomal protein S12 methylthiotransferase
VIGADALEEVVAVDHAHLPPPHDPFISLLLLQGIKLTSRHYAYLKISEGCNHRCPFCIIPSMRGVPVSMLGGRPFDMANCKTLVNVII